MKTTHDISKLSQIRYTISIARAWYLYQISLQIMLLPILICLKTFLIVDDCFRSAVSCLTRRAQHLRDLSRANDGKAAATFSSVAFSPSYQLHRIKHTMVFPFSRKNHDQETFRLLTWPLWYYDRVVCLFVRVFFTHLDSSGQEFARANASFPDLAGAILVHRGKW